MKEKGVELPLFFWDGSGETIYSFLRWNQLVSAGRRANQGARGQGTISSSLCTLHVGGRSLWFRDWATSYFLPHKEQDQDLRDCVSGVGRLGGSFGFLWLTWPRQND